MESWTHAGTASHGAKLVLQEFRRILGDGWKGHQNDEKKEEKEVKKGRRRRRHSRTGSDVSVDSLDLEHSASSSSSAAASGKPAASTSFKSVASETVIKAPAPTSSKDQATGALLPPPTAAGTGASTAPAATGAFTGAATDKVVPGISSPKAIR